MNGEWPSVRSLAGYIRADFRANPRDPKAWLVLSSFRVCQAAMGRRENPRKISYPIIIVYRLLAEFLLGIELRPKTKVGPGLSIYHGFGLVVNDHCEFGSRVKLRNGVTIGNREEGGLVPKIGDDVEIGAGAIILGDISIGDRARIGAGAVVLRSVPSGVTVVGNPARPVSGNKVSISNASTGSNEGTNE